MTRALFFFLTLAVACQGKPVEDSHMEDTGEPPAATRGLPQGASTWSGTGEVQGYGFLVDVALSVDGGGDITGSVTVTDDPEAPMGLGTGIYTIVGTHAPDSGVFAIGPVEWTEESNLGLELMGATGVYDPEAGTLTGQLRDYASGSDNTLQGGPFSVTMVSGDGAPTPGGDGAKALPGGDLTFTGTSQCTSSVREVEGTLRSDEAGAVTGTLTLGDPGLDNPAGTFAFDGAHNATTGTIVFAPQPWNRPAPTYLNFIIAGSFDPSDGAWDGDQLTNTAACPANTWHVTVVAP